MNTAGQVAFYADLAGGSSTNGAFVGTPSGVQTVALQGTAAPAGGNYGSLTLSPTINGAGRVAFSANLTGGSSTFGLFAGTPGAIQAVAIQGNPAPGGGNYTDLFFGIAINGSGQVAFAAQLTGPGVTTANDIGIYAGTVGSLVKVVRKGDQVDVDPGPGVDLRTVSECGNVFSQSGEASSRGVVYTNSGLLVYRLAFTDGSSGVFTSVVPVPESGGALATAGLALGLAYALLQWVLQRV
jgi:hypothetical protein